MPRKIKLAANHYTGLSPENPREQRTLLKLCIYAALILTAAVGLRILQQHWQQVRELTWATTTGTIQDVRPDVATETGTQYGGVRLYTAKVLVTFPLAGGTTQRWIAIRQMPMSLAEIQLKGQRWKGATCTVRWNPKNPNQIDAEVS